MTGNRIPKPLSPSSSLGRASIQRTDGGEVAQAKPLSRQRKWQLKQIANGNCERCGKPAVIESNYCPKHLRAKRVRNRKLTDSRPQAISGLGRPPLPLKTRREVSK